MQLAEKVKLDLKVDLGLSQGIDIDPDAEDEELDETTYSVF